MKTLTELKADMVNLANVLTCNVVVIKDCYVDLGTTYSLMYNKQTTQTFKVEEGQTPIEIVI